MRYAVRSAVPWVSMWAVLSFVGCTTGDDDDDTGTPSPTPDQGTPTPTPGDTDPTPQPVRVTISGQVTAVDRSSGEAIALEDYGSYAGAIVVYALTDPTDLIHPIGKSTLVGPGQYSIDVPEESGPVFVVAVADWDKNKVITSVDVSREALLSPVDIADSPFENVDVVLDLPRHGGGGGGNPPPIRRFSGTVTYDSDVPADIAVVAFPGDYSGSVWGLKKVSGSGAYDVDVAAYGVSSALIGYADWDHNGLFEPSDPAGLAEGNPYQLDQDQTGVDIVIEGVGPIGLPQPIPYVTVSGTVVADVNYNNSPIEVTLFSDAGVLYGKATLSAPGSFNIRVPGNLTGVKARAISDNDRNDVFDTTIDASGLSEPFNIGSTNVGGITLTLALPPAIETGLSGTISYAGTVGANDRLLIALFDQPDISQSPVESVNVAPTFPVAYQFIDLTPGTYYVAAALDVNGDTNGAPPGEDDVIGSYSLGETGMAPIVVTSDQLVVGIDFTLGS